MARVCFLEEKPKEIGKEEFIIDEPRFYDEIRDCKRFEQSLNRGLTASNHIKQIVSSILKSCKLDESIQFKIPYNQYCGLKYSNDWQLSEIIIKMLKNHCPDVIKKYVEYQIVNRPMGTRIIYFITKDLIKYSTSFFE